jgi:hypothetical protein
MDRHECDSMDSKVARAAHRTAAILEQEAQVVGIDAIGERSHQEPIFRAALSEEGLPDVLATGVKVSFPSWEPPGTKGRLGAVDVVAGAAPGFQAFFELKWAHSKDELGWTLWDIYKLAAGRGHFGVCAYAVVGAPVSYWVDHGVDCSALYCDGSWTSEELFRRYERAWRDLLAGGSARPWWVPAAISTRLIAACELKIEPRWELRVLRIDVLDDARLRFVGDWPEGHRPAEVVTCPSCRQVLAPNPVEGKRPHEWADLVYRCESCGWGFSNASRPSQRRLIAREPSMNVPPEARDGLDRVLSESANIRNRVPKRWRFCSENSEDAVTWTVIRGLQQLCALDRLVPEELRPLTTAGPSVVLWGAPAGGADSAGVASGLEEVSAMLGERRTSRTEPDVVIAWPGLLVFLEAKLESSNDRKSPTYRGWTLYTEADAFTASPEEIARSELYELVRNWRIGSELAGDRTFALVNLGRDSLDADVELLRPLLGTSPKRRLFSRRWVDVIPDTCGWLTEYARSRELLDQLD